LSTHPKAYLAFDLGAESGRAMLAHLRSGTLTLDEIHRFPNEPVTEGESVHWNVSRLWSEMRSGLAVAKDGPLAGIGVDTWGVDYALLGERGELLQNPYHYREPMNAVAMSEVLRLVPREEIYGLTGIQFMPINTLNQLFAAKTRCPRLLAAADRLLMIPDLFNYWLTGRALCEFTIASTTQMVNAVTRRWATNLMEQLELPSRLPAELVEPGSVIGPLLPGVSSFDSLAGTPVIASASHDTASAVAAITARDDTAFLSSGTWSLLGIELDAPVLTPKALRLNFSNEGGVGRTTRLLKNVMGLWMLQSCRKSWAAMGRRFTYGELMEAAGREPGFAHLIDPDDPSFTRPDDMPSAIDRFCARTAQPCPTTPGRYTRTILDSLALKYRLVLRDLEDLTGRRVGQIRIIGGGSKSRLLNQFTADATGARVLAGPAEATALGNIAVQMLATRAVTSLAEARAIIDRSFPTEVFEPDSSQPWDREAQRFQQYCEWRGPQRDSRVGVP
jgi:rhamnulokinase